MKVRVTAVWWVIAALAFVAIVAASAHAWRSYRLPARVEAALPAVPADAASKSAELAQRISAADARARSRASALDGVVELGMLYHANGYLREAEACWLFLRDEQPRDGKWRYYLADLRRTAGDEAAVSAFLAETVKLAPDYAASWLKLADLEFKTGRHDDAEIHYQRRLALLPADPYARLGLARIAMQRANHGEARRLIEEIIRETPGFPTAHNLLAELLAAEGREDDATRHRNLGREAGRFREADDPWLQELNDSCLDPDRLVLLGTMAYQARVGDKGLSLLERAARLAPQDTDTLETLGTLHLQLAEPARAQAVFENALRLPGSESRRVMLTVKLTDALRMQQRQDEALRIVREELARAPAAYELHNQLGAVLADMGQAAGSVEAYRRAVALAPNDTDSNFNLGAGLIALGREEEGVVHLKRSLTMQPTYPRALIFLGRLALEAGRMEEAYGYLKPLYDSNPDQPVSRQLLARYHMRLGEAASERRDVAAAEKHFREGLKVDPELAELSVNLGVLLLLQRRLDEAVVPFESYRRLRPQDPQACLFLGQVYAQLGRFADARKILNQGRDLAERAGNTVTANHCREILEHLPPEGLLPSRGGG